MSWMWMKWRRNGRKQLTVNAFVDQTIDDVVAHDGSTIVSTIIRLIIFKALNDFIDHRIPQVLLKLRVSFVKSIIGRTTSGGGFQSALDRRGSRGHNGFSNGTIGGKKKRRTHDEESRDREVKLHCRVGQGYDLTAELYRFLKRKFVRGRGAAVLERGEINRTSATEFFQFAVKISRFQDCSLRNR